MTWAKLKREKTWHKIQAVSVRISAQGYASPRMILRIARPLAQAAGLSLEKISRVDVLIGSGADESFAIVAANQDGEWPCYAAGKFDALKIVTMTPPGAPDVWAGTACAAESGDGGVMFRLPWSEAKPETSEEEVTTTSAPSNEEAKRDEPAELPAAEPQEPELEPDIGDEPASVAPPAKAPKVPQRAAPPPRIYPKYTFRHGGKAVELDPKEYGVATKLKAAIGKGFLPYDILLQAGRVESIEYLTVVVSGLRKKLGPLGLEIGVVKKMGYFMREREAGAQQDAEAAE